MKKHLNKTLYLLYLPKIDFKMKKGLVLIFALIATLGICRDENAWKEKKSVSKQYEIFKQNLKFYGGYYLLTEPQINEFQKSLSDSIDLHKSVISQNTTEIQSLKKELKSTKDNLTSTKKELDVTYTKVDSFDAFWGQTSKGAFSGLMYTTTLILLGVIGFIAFLFYRSNSITMAKTKLLEDVEAEFEDHRKKALDREMKLNRELQTERNKSI